jgi:DNA helicase IV
MLPENESVLPVLSQLNEKQREAVISEERRILVLAGAGSGKTKTLIQKVIYLIAEKNVDPQNILAITFTKNAANEMIDRLIAVSNKENDYQMIITDKKITQAEKDRYRREYIKKYPWLSNISVKTFHGLCNQILRKRGGVEFDTKYRILSDNLYDTEIESKQKARETPEEIINKIINTLCEDPEYLLNLKRYILDYYVDEYNVKLHEKGLAQYEKPFTTLKGDHVASKAERDVADWLYRHHINYHYEPLIAPGKFEMQPDFFIDDANIYLEVVSSKSYYLKDKEQAMKEAGENYLKLHDSATHDSNQFNAIMDKYIFSRIDKKIHKISPLDVAEEFRGYEKYRRMYVLDVLRMIDKIKVEDRNFEEIYQQSQKDNHARIRDFYTLSRLLWIAYHQVCVDLSYLDFNDLLIRTVSLLENNPNIKRDYQNQYKYILVDEFQDVNTIQVKLLTQLLKEENQLFCVGDDWQSIYGFRGSNVEYIVNFEKFFENPKLIKLDINYRSHGTIVEASNKVISHNKFKIEKEIKSITTSGKKIYLYCAEKESEDGVKTVVDNIDKLLQNGYTKEDILVLSRTRKTEAFEKYFNELRARRIKITTIHQSKGLEAKNVFIIGLTRGFQGFPNVRDDDRIFQLIKKSDFELNLEEERRLFYVALTRAKEELFLISEVGNESEFIQEIPGEFLDRTNFLILNLKNQEPKQCMSCKKKIHLDYIFCPYCGKHCLIPGSTTNEIKKETTSEEEIAYIILSSLQEIKCNTGRSLLCQILKGSKTDLIYNTKTYQSKYYGSLRALYTDKIISCIDKNIQEGFIEIYKSDRAFGRPLIRLTLKGNQYLIDNKTTQNTSQTLTEKVESQTDDTEKESSNKAYLLGLNPKKENIPILISYLHNSKPNDRRLAASALRKHASIKPDIYSAVPALILLLDDPNPQVRQYTIKALGEIRDRLALPKLEEVAANDKEEYNRQAAENAIESIIYLG